MDHLCETYLEKHDPVRKAERRQQKTLNLSAAPQSNETIQKKTSETASTHLKPARLKTRTPLSASIKHHVWLRDQGQCRFHHKGQRCGNRKYLEVHHKKPVSLGGKNQPENLVLLCREHHKTVHMRF